MQEWKKNVMQEVGREIEIIKQMYEGSMEAQKRSFQLELERMGGKVKQLELEVQALRAPGQQLTNKTPTGELAAPPVSSIQKGKRRGEDQLRSQEVVHASPPSQPKQSQSSTSQKSYAQVVKENPVRSPSEKAWTEVKYSNKKESMTKKSQRQEPRGRRISFPREEAQPKVSEEDIMLALNEALQKAGEPISIRFSRVSYSQSGAISALLIEKEDATELLKTRTNIFIRVAKTIDRAVIGVEALEHWQRLKVHGMLLGRYLGEGKMELLKREVESSIGINLKTVSRSLIHESRLRERLESGSSRGSAIVITVANHFEASYLCAKGLRFGGGLKVVEKFWEAGPGSVCPICCGIGHDRLGNCGQRPPQCTLCAGPHRLDKHRCGVSGCQTGMGKICSHVTATCANCHGNHQATSVKCSVRHKAEKEVRKKKDDKRIEKMDEVSEKENVADGKSTDNPDEENLHLVMENDDWAASPASSALSFYNENKGPDSANKCD